MKKLAFALIPAAMVALPAAAQAAPQGARAEVQLGWDQFKTGDDVESVKSDGISYGLGAGYDFAVAPTVSLGIDAEIADSSVEESESGMIGNTAYDASIDLGRDLYAGLRASFGIADNANVYLKGGITNVKADYRITYDDGASVITEQFSDDETGYRLGAGLQFGLASNAYAGGEYRYSNYDEGLDRHQVMATVGVRF